MKIVGPAKQIRIFMGDSDMWHGQPLSSAIVHLAHDKGMAGATVVHGLEGFGASTRIHTSRIMRLTEDLPVIVEIIDKAERINEFLPLLDEMVHEGLVTVQDVEIVRYIGNPNEKKR